jgi:hypothetical protein
MRPVAGFIIVTTRRPLVSKFRQLAQRLRKGPARTRRRLIGVSHCDWMCETPVKQAWIAP